MSQALSNVFKLRDIVNVKDPKFGAKGDGVTNDTAAIRAALLGAASGVLEIPPGTYAFDGVILIPSNIVIFAYNATFKCLATAAGDSGLYLTDATFLVGTSNSKIYGLTLDGNRANRTPPGGGALFYISSGQDHALIDCVAKNSVIDGFSVVGDTGWSGGINKRTRFINCQSTNAYRNGLSVVGTDEFLDIGGVYNGTTGAAPQAGVDVEPNGATSRNNDFVLLGTTANGNTGDGISINGTDNNGRVIGATTEGNDDGMFSSASQTKVQFIGCRSVGNATLDYRQYAMDNTDLTDNILKTGRLVKAGSQAITSATYVDVTSTEITYTPKYPNSFIRVQLKAAFSLQNDGSATTTQADVRIINSDTAAEVDSHSVRITATTGAGSLVLEGALHLWGQETNVALTNRKYKLQAQYVSGGGSFTVSKVHMVVEEISAG